MADLRTQLIDLFRDFEPSGPLVDQVIAMFATDHGDLRDRMADAILTATYPPDEWPDGPPGEGEMDTAREQADAALAVRCEHTAHIVARLAEAEHRAEREVAEHQVTRERLTKANQDLARLRAGAASTPARKPEDHA